MMMTRSEWDTMIQTLQHMGFQILQARYESQTLLIRPQPVRR